MKPARHDPLALFLSVSVFFLLCATSSCTASKPRTVTAGLLPVSAANGSYLGLLGKLGEAPLYVLHYEAPYDLDDLLLVTPDSADSQKSSGISSFACTCFSARLANGSRLFGRNFDWQANPALVLITRPTGRLASISMVDLSYFGYSSARTPMAEPADLADAWRLPFDGMNEKGLAVGMMAVPHAEGLSGEGRPQVGELGLIRILLEGATSVSEALALMARYDVDFSEPPIHYFLADAHGDAAVVEYSEGRLLLFRNTKPWLVATNFLFSEVPPERRPGSCERYAKASGRLAASRGIVEGEDALGLLKYVSQPSTRWSSSYDLSSRSLRLAIAQDYDSPFYFTVGSHR